MCWKLTRNICILYDTNVFIYDQRPHQELPFMNTSDLNNIQPSSLNYIPLHPFIILVWTVPINHLYSLNCTLPSGLNCRFLLKRGRFFKGKTSIKTKELDWKGTGFIWKLFNYLIRRSRTRFEKERGVKSYEIHLKEGEWNALRKNLIKRKNLINMVGYWDVKERPTRTKCIKRRSP